MVSQSARMSTTVPALSAHQKIWRYLPYGSVLFLGLSTLAAVFWFG